MRQTVAGWVVQKCIAPQGVEQGQPAVRPYPPEGTVVWLGSGWQDGDVAPFAIANDRPTGSAVPPGNDRFRDTGRKAAWQKRATNVTAPAQWSRAGRSGWIGRSRFAPDVRCAVNECRVWADF